MELAMPTTTCPECLMPLVEGAVTCTNCGHHRGEAVETPPVEDPRWCPYCGQLSVRVRGLHGFRQWFTLVLLLALGIVPGIIYYVVASKRPYCPACKTEV